MAHRRVIVPLTLLLQVLSPSPSTAQTPPACSYDACALRLRYSFFKTQLVQGREARPVASIGMFAPGVPLFAERSDTAARYYTNFRRKHTSSALLGLGSLVLVTVGAVVYDNDHDASLALVIGGGLLGIGGVIQRTRADEQLSRAVWWYNRTVASSP